MTYYALYGQECPGGVAMLDTDDTRFIYIDDGNPLTEGGALVKSHYHTLTSSAVGRCHAAATYNCGPTNSGSTSVGILPAGVKMVICQIIETKGFPSGSIIFSDADKCPAMWTKYADCQDKYVRFTETAGDASDAVTGALGAHVHNQGGSTLSSDTDNSATPAVNSVSRNMLTAYTNLYHIRLVLCKKD